MNSPDPAQRFPAHCLKYRGAPPQSDTEQNSTQATLAFFRIVESDLQHISHESSAFNRARTSGAIGAKMADKHESKTKKLMAAHEKRDFNQLDDFLFTVAESIEEAFLRAGAQPGKDYHYRDLFTLAAPFALEQWKKDMLVIPFWEELEKIR